MSEMNSTPPPNQPEPKFRINPQVFQILGLLGVALALPITILILGINGIRKERLPTAAAQPQTAESVAEVPGLRQSLESIANASLPVGAVDSPMRLFRLRPESPGQQTQKRAELLDFFKKSGVPFVETGIPPADSWVVQVEATNAESFEKGLISIGWISDASAGKEGGEKYHTSRYNPIIYKITSETAAP